MSLVSLFLAKDYLFKSSVDEQNLGTLLAQVQEVKNQMRYKHATSIFWDQAATSQRLFNGSEVFTGNASSAVIEMTSKDIIRVPADTLLRFSEDKSAPGGLTLNLQQGSLQLQGGVGSKGFNLRMGDQDLQIAAKGAFGLYLKKESSGELTFSVSSGAVTLQSGEQKKELKPGEALQLKAPSEEEAAAAAAAATAAQAGPDGDIKDLPDAPTVTPVAPKLQFKEIPPETISLLSPPDKKVLYGQGLEFFRWKPVSKPKLVLQYSQNPDFSEPVVSEDVTGMEQGILPKDLKKGLYHWRLVAYDGEVPLYSEVRQFSMEVLANNQLGQPQLQFKERGKWQLSVPVKDAKVGEEFHFQVSKKSEFTDVFDEYVGPQPLNSFVDDSGDFYIRLRKLYEGGLFSDWSNPIKQTVRPPLVAPVLTVLSEQLNLETGNAEISLNWAAVPHAADYLVQMSESPRFGSILRNIPVNKAPHVIRHAERVPTYLRVVARAIEGEYSPPSEAVRMKGVLQAPSIEKKEVLPALYGVPGATPRFHLLWNMRENAKSYRIDFSRDPKLAKFESFNTDNVEFFKPVEKEGWYYFRIWSMGDQQRFFLMPSPVLAASFKVPGLLIQPKILTPKNAEVFLIPYGVAVSLKFSWTESPENEWYELQMAQEPTFAKPVDYKVEGQEFVLKKPVANGKWYFRVRGRNKYQISLWSDTGVFYFGLSK